MPVNVALALLGLLIWYKQIIGALYGERERVSEWVPNLVGFAPSLFILEFSAYNIENETARVQFLRKH